MRMLNLWRSVSHIAAFGLFGFRRPPESDHVSRDANNWMALGIWLAILGLLVGTRGGFGWHTITAVGIVACAALGMGYAGVILCSDAEDQENAR